MLTGWDSGTNPTTHCCKTQESQLTLLGLSFLICNMGIIIAPPDITIDSSLIEAGVRLNCRARVRDHPDPRVFLTRRRAQTRTRTL